MKGYLLKIMMIFVISLLSPSVTYASGFGPDQWHQYRLNSHKNAVFNNGSSPLENKVFKTADQIRATPVIVEDTLYVGNHNTGDLFAFNVHSGDEVWRSKAPNWIHSEMIFHDGIVYVGFGNRFFQDNGIRGTGESGVLALDAESGETVWKYTTDGEVMPTPSYYDGAIYSATGDKHLYKLDPKNGDLIKKTELGSTVSMSSPNITGNTLFVGGSGPEPYTFYAYDLDEDDIKWERNFHEVVAGLDDVPAAVSENTVITTAVEGSYSDPEHFIYAVDADDGKLLWKLSLGKGDMVKNNKSGAPIIYEGSIYVGSPITQKFYEIDLKEGKVNWEYESGVMKAPPVAANGVVYFTNASGMVTALDSETGNKVGSKKLEGVLAPSGPIIMNDTLIVGSQDSNVYATPLSDILNEVDANEGQEEPISSQKDEDVGSNSLILILSIVLIGFVMLVFFVRMYRNKK